MKKQLVVLITAICLILCACSMVNDPSALPGTGEGSKEPVTLYIVTSYGGDDGSRSTFEAAIEGFEDATGVRVTDGSATSSEAWKTKVLTDFQTGSEPDVLFFFTNADADPIINANRVVSIEEIRELYPDYAGNMKESMLAVGADGRHYAVPATGYWENLFVNRAVLEACGVAVPGADYTWEQFLLDCETIRACGYTPLACSLFQVPHYLFEFAVLNNGSIENHTEVPSVDGTGDLVDNAVGRKWIAALEDIRELYERGFLPETTLTATDAETVEMFAEGQAAFMIDGSWQVGYLAEHYADRIHNYVVSCVPAKGERKATEAIGGISMGYFITRRAWEDPELRDAAVAFVSYLTDDTVLSTFVKTEVTALENGATPDGLNTLEQSAADTNARLTGVTGAVQDTISPEAKSTLFANIPKVVTGRMTAEEAVISAAMHNGQ